MFLVMMKLKIKKMQIADPYERAQKVASYPEILTYILVSLTLDQPV
jgi:hypothetical protein